MGKPSGPKKGTKHIRLYLAEERTQKRERYEEVIVPKTATKKQIEELAIQLCDEGLVQFDYQDEVTDETTYAFEGSENASDDITTAQEWLINEKGEWETAD